MHSPLKEALRQRRGKSLDLTIMIAPSEGKPEEEEKKAMPFGGEESPEEEAAEHELMEAQEEAEEEGEEDADEADPTRGLSELERKRIMEEEPRTLMDKVKRLALMRKKGE